jgi:nicotinamidase/pyrazinamidase
MKTVYFDIDTQIDFMFPAGALYVPGAEQIVPIIAQLNQHAAIVVSTMCAHEENDPEFGTWPPHCIIGTTGQLKPQSTLRSKRTIVPNTSADLAIENAEQILLEKQQLNLFTNPNLPRLLEALAADEYVVYGVVTEYCVKHAALGLLETGKPVTLVTDAIRSLSAADAETILQAFTTAGGKLATSSKLLPRR